MENEAQALLQKIRRNKAAAALTDHFGIGLVLERDADGNPSELAFVAFVLDGGPFGDVEPPAAITPYADGVYWRLAGRVSDFAVYRKNDHLVYEVDALPALPERAGVFLEPNPVRPLPHRAPRCHDLKCWPEFYLPVEGERKAFEVRKNDRDFRVGDLLLLREWSPAMEAYTGDCCVREVGYVLEGRDAGGAGGIEPGYCVMSLERTSEVSAARLVGPLIYEDFVYAKCYFGPPFRYRPEIKHVSY